MTQPASEADEMLDEYDFSNSVRAPYAELAGDVRIVELEADVSAVFHDSEAVNMALRMLINTAKEAQKAVEFAKAS